MNYNTLDCLDKHLNLHTCLNYLCEEYCDLLPYDTPTLDKSPNSIEFLRTYLSQNIPFIIRNGVGHWPALKKWDNAYLRSLLSNTKCTVAVTPNGFADAVTNDLFMLAEERIISFDNFLKEMEEPQQSQIFYLQKQNNSLIEEFPILATDVERHIPWATEAIGEMPEAVNFWMGDERAISSTHKDHYENIYCVVRGTKHFTLYPPVAVAWMKYDLFKQASYKFDGDSWKVLLSDKEVHWIRDEPVVESNLENMRNKTTRYECILNAGDVLYLPSLWYHCVKQSHSCIAVNYWYDMKYDGKYAYFSFLEKIRKIVQ